MKKFITTIVLGIVCFGGMAQGFKPSYQEKVVYEGPDVIFRQIDDHTWEGNGHIMANETVYLVEGDSLALLIDAGTNIVDLDKIVAGITKKPVRLVATHVHPDHTGKSIEYFPEIYINAADMVNVPAMMGDYKGEIKYLNDGDVINLGNRDIEVIFTPGHTPGSTTFIDKEKGYGFSGDAFGSGNLLLCTNFSTLKATTGRMAEYMKRHNVSKLYPGHYMGGNAETLKRVEDMHKISSEVLDGTLKGEKNPHGMLGLDTAIMRDGVRINYGARQVK